MWRSTLAMLVARCRWAVVLILCCTLAANAVADTHSWTDNDLGNSDWSDPDNWSPAGPPAFGDDVVIPAPSLLGSPGPAVLDVSPASVANVDIAEDLLSSSEGELQMLAGSSLVILAGTLDNDGLIVVNSDGGTQASRLRFSANAGDFDVTLSGNGTILLQAGAETFPTTQEPASVETITATVTQEADHTIRGVGRITAGMVNNGTVLAANLPSAPGANILEISDSSTGMTNNNVLGAEAGATLEIVGTKFVTQGASGVLQADDGATVRLRGNTVHISGGSFETKGTGLIINSSGETRLNGVVNEGTYQIGGVPGGPATTRVLSSGLTNNGEIRDYSTLDYLNSGALDGTGEVVMSGTISTQAGAVITHAATHTIRGEGTINAEMINNGLIKAEGLLSVHTNPTANNNEMRAASGGTLWIRNQVTQNNTTGSIIAEDGGTVKLAGTSRVTEGTFESQGSGVFLATDGARVVDIVNEAVMRVQPDTTGGTLQVEGDGMTNNGTITVNPTNSGASHRLNFIGNTQMTLAGSGTVTLIRPTTIMDILIGNTLTNEATHTIEGNGTIRGALVNEGTLAGDSAVDLMRIEGHLSGTGPLENVRISGIHAPGNSGPATANVTGRYEITAGGKLEMEVGGTTFGSDYDYVDVLGDAQLSGTLEVQLISGYLPAPNTGIPVVLTTGGVNGMFANKVFPDLYGGLYYDLEYSANQVALVVEGILGDYNLDGVVDAADYTVWRDLLGTSDMRANGDNTGASENIVDEADYDIWRANFGMTAPGAGSGASAGLSSGAVSAVPEPASHVLFGVALLAALSLGRRGRARHESLDVRF